MFESAHQSRFLPKFRVKDKDLTSGFLEDNSVMTVSVLSLLPSLIKTISISYPLSQREVKERRTAHKTGHILIIFHPSKTEFYRLAEGEVVFSSRSSFLLEEFPGEVWFLCLFIFPSSFSNDELPIVIAKSSENISVCSTQCSILK